MFWAHGLKKLINLFWETTTKVSSKATVFQKQLRLFVFQNNTKRLRDSHINLGLQLRHLCACSLHHQTAGDPVATEPRNDLLLHRFLRQPAVQEDLHHVLLRRVLLRAAEYHRGVLLRYGDE